MIHMKDEIRERGGSGFRIIDMAKINNIKQNMSKI